MPDRHQYSARVINKVGRAVSSAALALLVSISACAGAYAAENAPPKSPPTVGVHTDWMDPQKVNLQPDAWMDPQ